MRGARAKPNAGVFINVQKHPMVELGGTSWVKKPHLVTKPESHQGGWKSVGDASTSSTVSRKKGSSGGCHS